MLKGNSSMKFAGSLIAFYVVLLILPLFSYGDDTRSKLSTLSTLNQKQILDARKAISSVMPEIPAAKRRHIEELIINLGSPKWKVREQATEELSRADINAIPLISAAVGSRDLEVSLRAKHALEKVKGKVRNALQELSASIEILAAVKDKWLIGALIDLLESGILDVRYVAEYNLRRFTGRNFGYNSYGDLTERKKAVERWRNWWRQTRDTFVYPKPADLSKWALLVSYGSTKSLMVMSIDGKTIYNWQVGRPVRSATGLKNGNVIIGFEDGKPNVVEYDPAGRVVWDNSNLADTLGTGWVVDVVALPNGHVLLDYVDDCHVSEITRQGKVIWQKCLDQPDSAERLANGNTLITQFRKGKAVEVDQRGDVVWQYTNLYKPTDARRLPNGDTVICEYGRRRIIRVNRMGDILWQYRYGGVPGSVCLLPDGKIVVIGTVSGIFILDGDGKLLRQLHSRGSRYGRVRLVPIAVLNTRLREKETQ